MMTRIRPDSRISAAWTAIPAVIIGDSSTTRNMLNMARKTGPILVVGKAGNGLRGIQLCGRLQPKLVFVDTLMPTIAGVMVLQAIKQVTPEAMVFTMTSRSEHEIVLPADGVGVRDVLLKPLTRKSLKREVDRAREGITGEEQ